jgi:hypothetical protein
MADGASHCVVVSHWVGHDLAVTRRLLRQMQRRPAGRPFDLVIVCNGGGLSAEALPAPPAGVGLTIVNRENAGYNIGAWDAGWRAAPGYDYYLFLQDECRLRRRGWLAAFEARHREIGAPALLGEGLMWPDMTWEEVIASSRRDFTPSHADPDAETTVEIYRRLLGEMGIPEGPVATHLQTLVVFADGALLTRMDGLPNRTPYREAVACEIGLSRKAASLGARIERVDPARGFAVIAHPEWVGWGFVMKRLRRRWYWAKGWLKARLGLNRD